MWIGEVFAARDVVSVKDVVIKLEPVKAGQHFLEHEYHVYQKLSGGIGIPRVRWFGTEGGFYMMTLDCLGQSLQDLFVRCHFKFTVQTVLLLAGQLVYISSLLSRYAHMWFQVCRLEYIHSRNFIHRDLKPSNIVMGIGIQATMAYLIDFGLSKEYRNPDTYKHIPSNTNRGLTGTAIFASINSHLGLELGRRDDMESLAYILIYFLRGCLPWEGSPDMAESKQQTTPHNLCHGLPTEFCTFLEYCRSLAFEKKPDYGYLGDLFNNLSLRNGFQNDAAFDWDGADDKQPVSPGNHANEGQPLKHREGYVTFSIRELHRFTSSSTAEAST
jgi:serine/threonine protein kinase